MVKVTLQSVEPGVRVELHHLRADPERSQPIVSCVDSCSVHVPRGRYKFYVVGDDSFVSGSREVEIQDDVTLLIDPDTQEHRTVGLVLGVGGIVSFFVGIALLVDSIDESRGDSRAGTGGAMIVGSLVAIPVGWVMFGTSFKPEWDEEYRTDQRAKAPEPTWNVGFAPTKGGGMFGLGLTF